MPPGGQAPGADRFGQILAWFQAHPEYRLTDSDLEQIDPVNPRGWDYDPEFAAWWGRHGREALAYFHARSRAQAILGHFKETGIECGQQYGTLGWLAARCIRSLGRQELASELWACIGASCNVAHRGGKPPWTYGDMERIAERAGQFILRADDGLQADIALWKARGLGKPPPLQPSDAVTMRGRLRRQAMASVHPRSPR